MFLHGSLEEEVWMSQSEYYIVSNEQNKISKLKKAIYGLKLAAETWHKKINKKIKKLNFMHSTADTCLFTRGKWDDTAYIIVYVDRMMIAGKDDKIKEIINLKYQCTLNDLGQVSNWLGIKTEK